jgi:Flp pilus assembly protein TadD
VARWGVPREGWPRPGKCWPPPGEWGLARTLERSLELDPQSAGALALLGLALDQTGEDGSPQLQAAVELAPESAQVQLLLARHWRNRGQPEQALAALESAARLDPADPVVASDLASLYLALGDLRSAEAAYRYAAAAAPQDPLFWTLLARFSLEQEVDVASLGLPAARNALRLTPDDPRAIDLLAACHYLVGNLRVADRLLWQSLSMDPGWPRPTTIAVWCSWPGRSGLGGGLAGAGPGAGPRRPDRRPGRPLTGQPASLGRRRTPRARMPDP